jgi:hypothetical protein
MKNNQRVTDLVKGENFDLVADSQDILNRSKDGFCQLMNVEGFR